MKGIWLLIGLLIFGAGILGVFTQLHTTSVTAQAAPMSSTISTGAVKEIPLEISIRGFSPWNPSTWIVNEGDTVLLRVKSVSGAYSKGVTADPIAHTFVIDEYGIRKEVPAGGTIKVEFKVDDRAERFTFYDDTTGNRYQTQGVIEVRPIEAAPTGVIRVVPLTMNIKGFAMPSYQYFHATSNAVNVNLGDTVRFSVTSIDDAYAKGVETGAKYHRFNIDEYNIKRDVPAGETIWVEFIADKAGIFTFYDDIQEYRIQSQGVLIVN
jgi:hypothetical protein|tara:strand:+ start:178 stop:975 length:798 start_codon:yes stop_codon:yes gene_type:complete